MPPVCKDQVAECSVCSKRDTKTRSTRQNSKINWIQCDCCHKWLHASCGGITSVQYSKIRKDNIWFKCIICCLQQILLTDSLEDSTSIVNSAIDSARNRIQQPTSQSGSKKKGGKRSTDNPILDSPAQGTSYISNSTPSSNHRYPVHNISQGNSSQGITVKVGTVSNSVQGATEQLTDTGKCIGSVEFASRSESTIGHPPTGIHSTRCIHKEEQFQHSFQLPNRLSTNSPTLISSNFDIGLQGTTTTNNSFVFENRSVSDKIVIIDNINNPIEFNSSQRILQEIHNFCPDIKIDYAYSLAKGGIAIHLNSKSDRELLLSKLPQESFGSGVKHLPRGNNIRGVYVKGVDTSVDLQYLSEYLLNRGIIISDIRRLTRRHTGTPTQVIKVRCCEVSASKLCNTSIIINNKRCTVERERTTRVIRCFNCQRLGHIAAHCQNSKVCEFCCGSHGYYDKCEGNVKCANCGGDHPASSNLCIVYKNRYEAITGQHTKYPYFNSSIEADGGEVRLRRHSAARDVAAR